MRRLCRYLLFGGLLIMAGIVYFLAFTPSGLLVDIQIAARYIPGQLKMGRVAGTLFSEITLKDIAYTYKKNKISIHSLRLILKPWALLHRHSIIDFIAIDQADIQLDRAAKNSDNPSAAIPPFFKKLLPHEIDLNHVTIQMIHIPFLNTIVTLNGTLKSNWDITWQATIPEIKTLFPNLSGSLSASGTIQGPLTSPSIDAEMEGKKWLSDLLSIHHLQAKTHLILQPNTQSSLTLMARQIKTNDYAWEKFNLTIRAHLSENKQRMTTHVIAQFDQSPPITGQILLPHFAGFTDVNQPVSGTLDVTTRQLDFLTTLIPQLHHPQGKLSTIISLEGKIAAPILSAEMTLSQGSLTIPSLGITPTDIQLHAIGTNKRLQLTGHFRSGHGTANLQGQVLFDQPGFPITLTAKGQGLTAIDLAQYNVIASPNMTLHFANELLTISGEITIPKATLSPTGFNNTLELPSEVVFVDANRKNPSLPFKTALDINLLLGDHIQITHHELTTELRGNLAIHKTPDGIPTAAGELYTVKGLYKAYGQVLTIEKGRLIYTGNDLFNPGLMITASKKIKVVALSQGNMHFSYPTGTSIDAFQPTYVGTDELVVGVHITGTLDKPLLSLFSTPPLSQGDMLSYLLLGYPQSHVSGQQVSTLLSALSILHPNSTQFDSMTDSLQKKLGINELTVETTQVFNPNTNGVVSTTTVGVGKQLASNLYIRYSAGLFYPIMIINLRYQLGKHWAIQSETSTIDYGADVVYTIERN